MPYASKNAQTMLPPKQHPKQNRMQNTLAYIYTGNLSREMFLKSIGFNIFRKFWERISACDASLLSIYFAIGGILVYKSQAIHLTAPLNKYFYLKNISI